VVHGILDGLVSLPVVFDYLQSNLVSTLPEILLGYGSLPLFLAGLYFMFRKKAFRNAFFPVFLVWGLALVAYFLFEINAIGKVHDYYLFPFFPAIFILVGYGAEKLALDKRIFLKITAFILILSAPFICFARMQGRWDLESPGFNVNLLKYRQELRDAVPDEALCIAGNDESHRIFLYYIDKKGWAFDKNRLDPALLGELIGRGARYLYCDSRIVDEDPGIDLWLDELILQKGSVRVYRLREGPDHTEKSPDILP
jgi:hypothetical protein